MGIHPNRSFVVTDLIKGRKLQLLAQITVVETTKKSVTDSTTIKLMNMALSFNITTTTMQSSTMSVLNYTTMTMMNTSASLEEEKTPFMKTMDQVFLLTMAMLIQLMQCGFAFLEVGCVRSKNVSNIMMKTLLDSFIAGIAYWTLGFAFAYGEGNRFIGWNHFTSSEFPDSKLAYFFYEFVIASTASTIVSGAVAERCEMVAYLTYSFVLTAFVYPLSSRWAWSEYGWLKEGIDVVINGVKENITYHDFAGSGVVHAVGGTASFFAALILGPRIGRFHAKTKTVIPIRGHSVAFPSLGIMILLIGFLAFNGGSQMTVSNPGDGDAISRAMVNTLISTSFSAYTSLILRKCGLLGNTWNVLYTVNGALVGMVAICTGCDEFKPWAAAVTGIIAGAYFNFIAWLMLKLRIDDPVDAIAVHFGGGTWGVISYAFLNSKTGILANWDRRSGLILGWQLAGICSIVVWSGGLSAIMFGTLKYAGIFRVSEEMERKGLDIPKHGSPAYPPESYGHGYMEKILTILENGELSCNILGYCMEERRTGTDPGPYECADAKVMNNMQAKFMPALELNGVGHNDNVDPTRNGQINGGFHEGTERTTL